MRVLIIEDEQLLARQITKLLTSIEPAATIVGQTGSVDATVKWLNDNPAPDLMLMDIELADGQCFDIFKSVDVPSPVIFTTAYDEHALRAFKVNSIDYLLKPIQQEELRMAIGKWKQLQALTVSSTAHLNEFVSNLMKAREQGQYRDRFLVKQGQKMVSINTSDVALFSAKNTLNFLITKSKQKFLIDYTLDEIEELVQPKNFFRANRQYIIAHDVITAFHPWFNGKLKVDINIPVEEDIVISRERAPQFKAWMGA